MTIAVGTAVSVRIASRLGKPPLIERGTVVGHKVTTKGVFLIIRDKDGKERKARPAVCTPDTPAAALLA